jgi:uncharacterized membrane protein YkgB
MQVMFDHFDAKITTWLKRHSITLLRMSLGIIFLWFGVLKFFPGSSSAEALATHTIEHLTFGIVRPPVSLPLLAVWETMIGLGLIFGLYLRMTLLLLLIQMVGTLTPLILFPHETFSGLPVPTFLGQYIIKNIVLLSSGCVIGSTLSTPESSEP